MFVIKDIQFQKMEQAKLNKVIHRTCEIIKEEFPRLVRGTEDEFHKMVGDHIREASSVYKIQSFDLLEDFMILALQRPVIINKPIPADIERILKWPGMDENNKMSELNKLISKKY